MPHKDPEARRAYMKKYQQEKRDPAKQRNYKLRNRYGIDEAAWWEMLEAQEWACKICCRPWKEDDVRAMWHTDHSHETGRVRGILCSTCNRGLGQFQDSPELLRQAALYVERG